MLSDLKTVQRVSHAGPHAAVQLLLLAVSTVTGVECGTGHCSGCAVRGVKHEIQCATWRLQ
jgi:hypothetical protein